MTIHDTIIRALAEELQALLPECTLTLIDLHDAVYDPHIRIDSKTPHNSAIATLKATTNGIWLYTTPDQDNPTIEYCDPNLIPQLIHLIKLETQAFHNIKQTIRKLHYHHMPTTPTV